MLTIPCISEIVSHFQFLVG